LRGLRELPAIAAAAALTVESHAEDQLPSAVTVLCVSSKLQS